jgi:TM2 domain-containing membrane protein YozV
VQVAGIERTDEGTVWTCPSCQHKNPIDVGTCPVCGTPFARLFQEPEIAPDVQPSTAAALSLLLPGLGHWKLGRRGEALARVVLFVWSFGTVFLLSLARRGTGLGSLAALYSLFVVATLALWLESTVDAYRIAAEERPFVSARMLMWASAAFVVVSAIVATLVALPAARGR